MLYPTEPSRGESLLLLVSTVFCSVSCVNCATACIQLWLTVGRSDVTLFLPCPCALAARGAAGREVKFLLSAGTCGSFLPPQKSHLARWWWTATSCPPGQQEMAESRGDSSPHPLRRSCCRDISPVGRSLFLSAGIALSVLTAGRGLSRSPEPAGALMAPAGFPLGGGI